MTLRRSALLVLLALTPISCVSHVFRHAEPAVVERVGLDTELDDLVLVEVVHGVGERAFTDFVVVVPQGWQTAPAEPRSDGCFVVTPLLPLRWVSPEEREVSERQLRFGFRDTFSWTSETRAKHDLLEPEEMERAHRRDYRVVNLRRADGGVDVELRGHRADGQVRVLAVLPLPQAVTPRELSTAEVVLLAPPLAILDAAFVPLAIVGAVVTVPFHGFYFFGADTDRLPALGDYRQYPRKPCLRNPGGS